MTPFKFKLADAELKPPITWKVLEDGPCHSLPITRAHGCVYSCWKPSLREWLALVFGKPVQLVVKGETQPPIIITVGEP